jgi:hypothetical protein
MGRYLELGRGSWGVLVFGEGTDDMVEEAALGGLVEEDLCRNGCCDC